jgi:hypothetical protein
MAITVSRAQVEEKNGVVILPIREYRRLLERAVPNIHLVGKAARDLDKLVADGLREHREGKTRKIKSLADLD